MKTGTTLNPEAGAELDVTVRIGSNISSIQAQHRLSDSSAALSKTYERLASGQRINRASDDAAGLSIADSLGVGRRVFTQGVRNLNDGISALQIADSAVSNLSQIVTRIGELAEQSANGTFSSTQRKAIDNEAKELQKEYFRISRSAEFNGTNLFDGSLANGLRLQGGFGADGSIQGSLGGVMGDGMFSEMTSYTTGASPNSVTLGDLNGDGVLDMVTADLSGSASVLMGKGDGTFSTKTSYTVFLAYSVALGDLNRDGVLDMVTAGGGLSGAASVFLGQGDGTFSGKTSYTTGVASRCVTLGDLNGDGVLDMVTADYFDGTASVLIGKGDGTFSAKTSYIAGIAPASVTLGDLNGDGVLDMVTVDRDTNSASVLIGKGDGTFSAMTSYTTGLNPYRISLGDLNGDGVLDMVTGNLTGGASVLVGKGDGTFSDETSYTAPFQVTLGDLNGDGVLDMVAASDSGTASVLIGKGDGTFSAATSFTVGSANSVTLGDVNGDGVLDMVTAGGGVSGAAGVLLGETREGIAPLLPFSLGTQADALQAMAPLDRKLSQLAAQRGVIGAFQSRLSVAINTLQSTGENYAAAESRIRDTDVASDAAELTRLQISRQVATAVLAQANQQPALAIRLLRSN